MELQLRGCAPRSTKDRAPGLPAFSPAPKRLSFAQPLPSADKKANHSRLDQKHVLHTISPPRETVSVTVNESSTDEQKEGFDWYHNWYPMTPVGYLDPSKPHAITLLGKNLVLWKDEAGNWSCLEDVCSHRLARLSEGRIEPKTGNLMCSYHGWQFNGQGKCTAIPQAADAAAEQKMCKQEESCVKKFPVKESIGLLWVWPESGPMASLEAATKSLHIPPGWDTEPDQWLPLKHWFMRDLPYSWDTLVENVVDPSHVAFAHHGVQGNREKPMISNMTTHQQITLPGGFTIAAQPINKAAAKVGGAGREDAAPASKNPKDPKDSIKAGNEGYGERFGKVEADSAAPAAEAPKFPPTLIHFKPPNYTLYEIMGGRIHMVNYAVPTAPGMARIIHKVAGDRRKLDKKIQRIAGFKPDLLICKDHMENNAVIDGDGVFLHYQERDMGQQGLTRHQYFTPTSMDRAVNSFKRWWDLAGNKIPWAAGAEPGMSERPSRREMLDRWDSHTRHCPTCQKALRQLKMAQQAAAVLAGLTLLAAAGLSGAALAGSSAAPQAWKFGAAALGGALLSALSVWLEQWKAYFFFRDYVHSEH
ncbi:hypothetical protein WJX84_010011 [Apatococcus fuscideae]|uniref:Rieske domain-containing protein n=1 Tax=Apatococcus fuscideae TaxID=2026836 RepID=A0AAW1TEZ1_9CHLO